MTVKDGGARSKASAAPAVLASARQAARARAFSLCVFSLCVSLSLSLSLSVLRSLPASEDGTWSSLGSLLRCVACASSAFSLFTCSLVVSNGRIASSVCLCVSVSVSVCLSVYVCVSVCLSFRPPARLLCHVAIPSFHLGLQCRYGLIVVCLRHSGLAVCFELSVLTRVLCNFFPQVCDCLQKDRERA
jgi:hypothetical protein